jgi:2-dehydro-3-deoxyphosphogluconate aldolase / (4S)-4-hydroxy-2-oxoglutarate aldolase
MSKILEQIRALGIVPVVAIEDASDAVPLAQALIDGGLPCAEITFRTSAAADAIRNIIAVYPEMLVAAGTVLSVAQAQVALDAGVKFIVTPGFDADVVDFCLANDVPIFPGVVTPTEINMALQKGLKVLKFFPAEVSGGIKMLKAIGGPYTEVQLMPTGGISLENVADYLALPQVVACGGSWVVKKQLINEGKFDQIKLLTQDAVKLVKDIRSTK